MAIPKRSYWLRKVVSEEGMSYHISFRDGQGKIQELCVSYDFFMAFRRHHGGDFELAGIAAP